MKEYFRTPKSARAIHGDSCHWYANQKSIDIYGFVGGRCVQVRITREQLAEFLRETKPSPRGVRER